LARAHTVFALLAEGGAMSTESAEEVVGLTRDLVAVPSHEAETAVGDDVEAWLRRATDAAVRRDDAGNVLARKGATDAAETRLLALVCHHDVVPPDETQVADGEYVVDRRDGRLYGRGTADMKGALAAAMLAFRDATPTDGTELVLSSFVGEEQGGVGARAAIDDGFAPDHAVVTEGSTGYSAAGVTDVAVAHKGRRGATVTATGTAAHASEVAAGENAIYRASEAVNVLRELAFPTATVLGHDIAGSLAVTEIEGGRAMNVIPERCTVTVDERTVPGDRAAIDRVESVEGVTVGVDQDLPPMACDDPAFADAVLAAARDVQTAEALTAEAQGDEAQGDDVQTEDTQAGAPAQVVKPHATDAGWLAEAGTACVVCGPAEPGEAHTADESVSIAVLERCRAIYQTVAERW
jgi:acetylornithine deacetylase